jgi:wnt family.
MKVMFGKIFKPVRMNNIYRNRRIEGVLRKATKLAVSHCREVFQYEPWNCTTTFNRVNLFQKNKCKYFLLYLTNFMAYGGSVLNSQGLSSNIYPKPIKPNFW